MVHHELLTPLTSPIRILLVEDHAMMREGLRLLLAARPDLVVVDEAGTSDEALTLAARHQPNVILLDLQLGRDSGLELLPKLLEAAGEARVIVLTASDDVRDYKRSIQYGARGVVLKDKASRALLRAIDRVAEGEMWIDTAVLSTIVDETGIDNTVLAQVGEEANLVPAQPSCDVHKGEAHKPASLSERECEVIALVAEGLKNQEIADRLFVTERTVRYHLNCIFQKLGIGDRSKLLVYAYRHGLTAPQSPPTHDVSG